MLRYELDFPSENYENIVLIFSTIIMHKQKKDRLERQSKRENNYIKKTKRTCHYYMS